MQSLEFLRAWRAQARTWQNQAPAPPALVNGETLAEALAAGDPAMAAVPPQVPADLYAGALADLAGLLAARQQAAAPAALALAAALRQAGPAEREALVRATLADNAAALERWAEGQGLSGELLPTLAGLALQPFLARFAAGVAAAAPLHAWRRNYCPVCGREPDVARVDPDNLRYLHCPQCDTQWQHHRLSCVWCDTDDVKKVEILTVAELEPWRADLCDACGGYIKTLDQRHGGLLALPNVDLFLEDARTLKLDLVARQQGYRRGGRVQ